MNLFEEERAYVRGTNVEVVIPEQQGNRSGFACRFLGRNLQEQLFTQRCVNRILTTKHANHTKIKMITEDETIVL